MTEAVDNLDIFEEAMHPYITSPAYNSKAQALSKLIHEYEDDLTSKSQRTKFRQIMDMLREDKIEFGEQAFNAGCNTRKRLKRSKQGIML